MRRLSTLLVPLATACALEEETIDTTQFEADLCNEQGSGVLAELSLEMPVDYIERRQVESYGEPMPESVWVEESSGTRCAGATDPPACEADFAALPLESDWISSGFDGSYYRSLAYTRGDEAGAILDQAQLLQFLGPLDAPADGALAAIMAGHRLVCDATPDAAMTDDGIILHTRSGGGCGQGDDIEEHVVLVRPDGTIEVLDTVLVEKGDPNCAVGRLPAGLCRRVRTRRRAPVGDFLAEVAHLEAAAVSAFEQLAAELSVHGAPRSMIAAARRARLDEVRHARTTAALARRWGGRPVAPRVAESSPRSLAEVTADNATEGCIRETYGALVAHVQARRAADPIVRRALHRIAADETRHAALSWQLHAWAHPRLSPVDRRRVDRARAHALQQLRHDLTAELHPAVHHHAGMPHPDLARHLFDRLHATLRT